MRLRYFIIGFILVLAQMTLYAGPARHTAVFLKQPDGSVFQARIRGDEFTRIKTDISGRALIQDADGWWNYAVYEADGSKVSSGWRVGDAVPDEILSASLDIPYDRLSMNAKSGRQSLISDEVPVYRRMKEAGMVQTRSGEETGTIMKHGLVILANFKDVKFKHSKEDFEYMLTEQGYSVNGATGSAKEYFDAQFNGLMEFDFHVTDMVTLSKNRDHYGSNDTNGNDKAPAEMVAEACRLVDNEIDFSLYDDDKDGTVDNVFLFFAGEDEAEGADEECIWSHAWYIFRGAGIRLELDGTRIDRYACTSELTITFDSAGNVYEFISGIGTFCHEYSHTLGLPDFYDTNYEETGGIAAGLWNSTSLMDGGNYNNLGNTPPYYNALERLIAGISEPEVLDDSGKYTLNPIGESGSSYMLKTDDENIFYLFECRANKGWDSHIGGSGMLAYRIDISDGGYVKWMSKNETNIDPSDQHADLMEADGRTDSFSSMEDFMAARKNIAGIFFPYGGKDTFEISEDISLTYIKKEGNSIRFNLVGKEDVQIPPTAVNITKDVFADAAIIGFESSYPYDGYATFAWGRSGSDKETIMVKPYDTGKYAVVLEGLEEAGKTYEIDICFSNDMFEGETKKTSVMTKRMPAALWPYIYLGSMERNSDGSFMKGSKSPLRIYGAVGAQEIRWEFNGKPISHDGDGYYRLNESGVLQATIWWEDGSVDKVMKQINIAQ
ncbi:MAG: M6 family metalloprotease domain-containing protein [Bacteroidales bacterium]|nr:M6 family metalloprotease domain-containing protein [Bacteroidales bacterium]